MATKAGFQVKQIEVTAKTHSNICEIKGILSQHQGRPVSMKEVVAGAIVHYLHGLRQDGPVEDAQ